MNHKTEIKQQLIANFVKQYKYLPESKRLELCTDLLKQAQSHSIPELINLFEGFTWLVKKEYVAAKGNFLKSIVCNRTAPFPWYGLGVVYREQRKYSKAKEAFLKAIKLDDKFVFPWVGIGALYREQNEYSKAEDAYVKAISLDDKFAYPWYGLGVLYRQQKDYSRAEEAFCKAIALDDKNIFTFTGLAAVYREKKDYLKAEETLRKAISLDEKHAHPWYGLGAVYREKKDVVKAEEAYRKAIALDSKFAYPWSGLGIIYCEEKEYAKAEEFFRKAIALDNKADYAWSGLGVVYREQKEYAKAEEAYKMAVSLDEYNAFPWTGLGITYCKRKEYAKAEESFKKAILLDEKNPYLWRNLGLLFIEVNKPKEAIARFEKARDLAIEQNNQYLASIAENNLKDSLEKIKEVEAINIVRRIEKVRDPLEQVLLETESLEDEVFETQKSFQSFVSKPADQDDSCLYLKVLRRWNSYTPIVSDNFYVGKGGGYFLKVGKKGVVIDPGFNFIDNFKGANHTFDEIDVVIISHAHNDHTSDLESILTLLSNCNKRRKGVDDFTSEDTVRADIAKSKGIDIRAVTEGEIEEVFATESPRRKKIDLYLTKSVQKKFSGMLTSSTKNDYVYHGVEKGDIKKILGKLKMYVIEAKHDDIISDADSVGFMFEFNKTLLVYTGDTGWDAKIEKQYAKIRSKFKRKEIVLLAHIGGFKDYERKYLIPKERLKAFYKNHLGRLGLGKLIETIKPTICIISEFGEELRKHREELAGIFNDAFKFTKFISADIGLEYYIKDKRIRAITQLELDKYEYTTGLIKMEKVKTCLLRKDYSLHYYDGSSKLKEGDLLQVLIEKFDRSSK